jgi:chromosome segregation ATPase
MRLGRGSPNTINDHLDAWWTKLGSRLRDVPGREFPQLPERVGQALHHLWNEALEGAHAALAETLAMQERERTAREQALAARATELAEREQAMAARAATIEESLTLAREQLAIANRTIAGLQSDVRELDAEREWSRTRIEALEGECQDLRRRIDAAAKDAARERTLMQERHEATERHWLAEIDRARQAVKDATKEHDRQSKELQAQVGSLQNERDRLRQELIAAGGELRITAAVRQQLEERLRARAGEDDSLRARKFRPRNPGGHRQGRS